MKKTVLILALATGCATAIKPKPKTSPTLVDLNTTPDEKVKYSDVEIGNEKQNKKTKVIIVGSLTKDEIRKAIKTEIPKYKYCYDKELQKNTSLQGIVKVRFLISATGMVQSASAESFDQKVGDCIVEIIKTLEFPKPKGGGIVMVKYPFNFINKKAK